MLSMVRQKGLPGKPGGIAPEEPAAHDDGLPNAAQCPAIPNLQGTGPAPKPPKGSLAQATTRPRATRPSRPPPGWRPKVIRHPTAWRPRQTTAPRGKRPGHYNAAGIWVSRNGREERRVARKKERKKMRIKTKPLEEAK